MKIGIIGPTKIEENCRVLNIKKQDYLSKIKDIASYLYLKNYEIVVVPDKGSVAEFFAKNYKGNTIGIIPKDDKEFGYSWLNLDICKEIINCGSWRNQPEKLDELSDIILCLGYTPGSLIEICYTKWFKVNKIYIIKEFISTKLPKEIESRINLNYITINQIKDVL